MEDAKKEERTFRDASNIGEPATALGGQLIVRFKNPEADEFCFKIVSAHIVKEIEEGKSYAALTSRLNMRYAPGDGEEW